MRIVQLASADMRAMSRDGSAAVAEVGGGFGALRGAIVEISTVVGPMLRRWFEFFYEPDAP